jgi:hypothetical protein
MRLSQSHLNLLETCPRKFQHVYLDQLGTPPSPEQQEYLDRGSRFHLLMQQRELGLPVEVLLPADQLLRKWMETLEQVAPHLFHPEEQELRQSEHRRTMEFAGHMLTVVYDLVILSGDRAQILDWKTHLRPRSRRSLEQDWQTRLYPFVLAETSDYLPEQITMSYWFVQALDPSSEALQPAEVRLTYSQALHQQTSQQLLPLLQQLDTWVEEYQQGIALPQVNLQQRICSSCMFAPRCQRHQDSEPEQPRLLTLSEIQEFAL